jgi:tryptophan synthase beta chain
MTPVSGKPASSATQNDQEQVESLRKALASEPERQDLRLRLLRLHFVAGRAHEFIAEAQQYKAQRQSASAQSEWHVVAEMGRVLAPDSALFRVENDLTVAWDYDDAQLEQGATRIERFGEGANARTAVEQLSRDYEQLRQDPKFIAELDIELTRQARPTPLHLLPRLSAQSGGAQVFLKREDFAAPGSRLTIHAIGQALLARRLGKACLVTGTIDGRVGVTVASIAARLGLQARVFMESEQYDRQTTNVLRMELMGAQVDRIERRVLKNSDIREAALEYWLAHHGDSFMVCGLTAGPRPYPIIAEDLSAMIGRECRRQLQALAHRTPDVLMARGGENTDAIGFFAPFLQDKNIKLVCVEPEQSKNADEGSLNPFSPNIQLNQQQNQRARAILEGMEYASVRREHDALRATRRVEYVRGKAADAMTMVGLLGKLEGLTPALETAQVLAVAYERSRQMKPEQSIIVMYAEQPDKDLLAIGLRARK